MDVGVNAELEYSITEGEGLDMFDVVTDQDTQEGIIRVKKVTTRAQTPQMGSLAFLCLPSQQELQRPARFFSSFFLKAPA